MKPASPKLPHSKIVKTLVLAATTATLLTGCVTNPFARYYQSYTNQMPASLQRRLLPPSGIPQVITTSVQNYNEEARHAQERGYIILGSTGFWGFNPTQGQVVEQAKKVGAELAIWASEYSHTEQGIRPIVTYQPGQTYTTQTYGTTTANAYGSGGYAYGSGTYSGQSTTTTPGTVDTHYVPYERRIYNHGASFWRRIKPGIFGANFVPIPDDLRTKLQRNTGVFVAVVVQGGAAFKANIMRGDVIVQMADKPVATVQELRDLLPSYAGQKVPFKVIRDAQTLEIQVQLNEEL